MKRGAAVLLVLATCMAAGCGVSAESGARVSKDSEVPFGLLDQDAPALVPLSPGPSTEIVELCFVRGDRMTVIPMPLPAPADVNDTVVALSTPPPDAGGALRTALTDPSVVRRTELSGGIARVDIVSSVALLSGDEQMLAVAQLVCTLTARPGVGQVSFTLDGAPLAVPTDNGSLVTSPVARDDYASLMP